MKSLYSKAYDVTKEFGDLFVYRLDVNFQSQRTEIEFGEYITPTSTPIKKMVFEEVIWQEFSEFDFCSIFNTIEIDDNFEDFHSKHVDYFKRMANYITLKNLESICNAENIFYSFKQTAGLNCFVISKCELQIRPMAISDK